MHETKLIIEGDRCRKSRNIYKKMVGTYIACSNYFTGKYIAQQLKIAYKFDHG